MPLYKFGAGDVFYNQIKAHPSSSFFIYDSKIYYQDKSIEPGANVSNVGGIPTGHVSLFEMNVDRSANTDSTLVIGSSASVDDAETDISARNVPDTGLIYPFVYKGLAKMAFKTHTRDQFIHDYNIGDVITGSYQMSSSISRKLYRSASFTDGLTGFLTADPTGSVLRNLVDHSMRLGQHYHLTSSNHASDLNMNVIDIPSIFYGSEIKKGSVKLKYYVTGTLTAELRDSRYDGALIQRAGTDSSAYDSEIAGVVLYKEGFIILTGSWNLCTTEGTATDKDYKGASVSTNPRWVRFGLGANDTNTNNAATLHNNSSSFAINFQGTHKIPTVTMLAHANKGELNYSNNPTYIEHTVNTASYNAITASYFYGEKGLSIKNIHSSSYSDPTGSLKKTTYITKIGIYDDKKKLIGIASVAKPVKKTEERDLTFKLKLDI